MITSASNAQVKKIILLNKKSRERKKEGVFLVEGLKMFGETPRGSAGKDVCFGEFSFGGWS